MKLSTAETVAKVAFAAEVRPWESAAAAAIRYWVPWASARSGLQLVPLAEIVPATVRPVAVAVMVTERSLPSVTVTFAPSSTLARCCRSSARW